jgi:hypothetical protein
MIRDPIFAGLVYDTDTALTSLVGLHGYPIPPGRFFGVPSKHTPDKGFVSRVNTPNCQDQRAGEIHWREQKTCAGQPLNAFVFGLIPADNNFQAGPHPEMPPHVQQLKVCL